MKPSPFDWVCPDSLEECLELLVDADDTGAKILAGGQSLMPIMNLRLAVPEQLIDVNRIPGLDTVHITEDAITLGGTVRHTQLLRNAEIIHACPLLPGAVEFIGHPAIRNCGTLGGSLAHADPAAELPAAMSALDASFVCQSHSRGSRVVPAREFFLGSLTTVLEADEMLTEVRVPVRSGRYGYAVSERTPRAGDFAVAGACAVIRVGDGGRFTEVSVVMFGEGAPIGTLCTEFNALVGTEPDLRMVYEVCDLVAVNRFPDDEYLGQVALDVLRDVTRAAVLEATR